MTIQKRAAGGKPAATADLCAAGAVVLDCSILQDSASCQATDLANLQRLADDAKAAGNYEHFWKLRRSFLLLQAQLYCQGVRHAI